MTVGDAFAVSKYDITFDDWEACALEGGCTNYRPKDSGWGRGRRPVIYVSCDDAKAYIDWLRQKTGKQYRLLTEAEWEFAARAGTTTPYASGRDIGTDASQFRREQPAGSGKPGTYHGTTVEVGSFPPNPYGLYDMDGNVLEWVEDCWNRPMPARRPTARPRRRLSPAASPRAAPGISRRTSPRPAARMSFPKGAGSTWSASASRGRWSSVSPLEERSPSSWPGLTRPSSPICTSCLTAAAGATGCPVQVAGMTKSPPRKGEGQCRKSQRADVLTSTARLPTTRLSILLSIGFCSTPNDFRAAVRTLSAV